MAVSTSQDTGGAPCAQAARATARGAAVTRLGTAKGDLEAAEIPAEAEAGRIGYHALRHSCATNIARAGVPSQHHQAFMPHAAFQFTPAYDVHWAQRT